jgi:hypothetical protein
MERTDSQSAGSLPGQQHAMTSPKQIAPTNKRSLPTQDGSSKDSKMAKSSEHWLNPTPSSSRISEDDVNKPSPECKDSVAMKTNRSVQEDPYLSDVWGILECPVCLQIVAAPVLQCRQGHHMCNACSKRVSSCPLCKRSMSTTRNYAVEAMVDKIPLPCRYRVEGCNEMMCQKDKAAHEDACEFYLYTCFVQDCFEAHSSGSMRSHLKTSHSRLITETDSCIHKG